MKVESGKLGKWKEHRIREAVSLGRGKSKCKGPEVWMCSKCLRNSKEASRARGRMGGSDVSLNVLLSPMSVYSSMLVNNNGNNCYYWDSGYCFVSTYEPGTVLRILNTLLRFIFTIMSSGRYIIPIFQTRKLRLGKAGWLAQGYTCVAEPGFECRPVGVVLEPEHGPCYMALSLLVWVYVLSTHGEIGCLSLPVCLIHSILIDTICGRPWWVPSVPWWVLSNKEYR